MCAVGGGGGGGGGVEALGLLTLWGVSKPSNWPLGVTVPIRVKTRRPFLSCHLAWRSHTRRISDCFVEQGGKSGAGVVVPLPAACCNGCLMWRRDVAVKTRPGITRRGRGGVQALTSVPDGVGV